MNRLGMIDVSHLSDDAVAQSVALSRAPVVATQPAFRHFTPGFERNLSDALAKAIADKGGVIQVPFGNAFVDPASAARREATSSPTTPTSAKRPPAAPRRPSPSSTPRGSSRIRRCR